MAAVRAMVEEDSRVTVAQLAHDLGTSSGSVSTILHEKLGYRKVCARWVPHMLTEDQERGHYAGSQSQQKVVSVCSRF